MLGGRVVAASVIDVSPTMFVLAYVRPPAPCRGADRTCRDRTCYPHLPSTAISALKILFSTANFLVIFSSTWSYWQTLYSTGIVARVFRNVRKFRYPL